MPRILIADDEPNIREVIAFALERAGFSVSAARNGAEALQAFRKAPLQPAQGSGIGVLDGGGDELVEQAQGVVQTDLRQVAGRGRHRPA